MSAVNYTVRSAGGTVSYGQTNPEDGNFIPFYTGAQISLNLSPQDIAAYKVSGENLIIELTDGQTITLQGYFFDQSRDPDLFLSAQGEIQHVELGGQVGDQYLASYAPIDTSGKWSAYDQLVFLDLERVEPVVAPLAAPLLGGLGSAAAATAAVVGGGYVLSQTGGGGGGGSSEVVPTVDNPDGSYQTGGPSPAPVNITGTGEPGSKVNVSVGSSTRETVVGEDGKWSVTYQSADLPADGVYESVVKVTNPAGKEYTLDGPALDIDTTPPAVAADQGTVSVNDIVNAAEHQNGHTIGGTGEAGAKITVEIKGQTQTTTVADNGRWSVTFDRSALAEGEYTIDAKITAEDARGNITTSLEKVAVDTVAPAIAMNTIEGDNIINAAEAADGVTLAGTGEPGASLSVEFQGKTTQTTVAADGTWSLSFNASQIQTGTYDSAVKLTATDAAGNSTVTDYTLKIDTDGNVTLNTPIAGDNIVNGAEAAQGLNLSGTAEAGSTVVVQLRGATRTVTADQNGTWNASFTAAEIPAGQYSETVTVTATDSVGNQSSTSSVIQVDTSTNVGLNSPIAGDNIINAAEAAGGVTLNGTAEAGAQVQVTLAGANRLVTADQNGNWSANFSTADIPSGTYPAAVTVTATDKAGNTATSRATVQVDTEIGVAMNSNQAGGDDIINASEASAGVTLTGTGEAGAQVSVLLEGVTKTATVAQNGTWSVTYASGEIRDGEYNTTAVATITDAAGNTDQASLALRVDTKTSATIAVQDVTIGGDDFVNAAEMNNGLVLNGTAEAGATVSVEIRGVTRTTTADNSGNWSVTYEPGSLPRGEYQATATVTTTDAVGNVASSSTDFHVDTEVPNPIVESVTFADDQVSAISVQSESSDFSVASLNSNGTSTTLSPTELQVGNDTMLAFNPTVPDGTHLVVSSKDTAGNISDTMIVLDDNATNATTLNHAAVGNFQIEAIELDYAAGANLQLTEAQIKNLSNASDTLTIHGGTDDQVTVTGAQRTGSTKTIDGEAYDVYTVGNDGVTLIVDQDINVII